MSRLARRASAALLLAFAAGAPAQVPDDLIDRRPKPLVQDVLNSPYGRLLVAEFGRVLRDSAKPECLAERGLRPEQLEARGRDLLATSGAIMLDLVLSLIDGKKLEAEFRARAGERARAELVRLRDDPDVKKYLKLTEPAKLSKLANQIVETVDRHALLARAGLVRRAAPVSTGNEALLRADPEEKSLEDAERFVLQSQSPRLKRFVDIQVALAEAYQAATDHSLMIKIGPSQMTPNVPGDLQKLCVFPK